MTQAPIRHFIFLVHPGCYEALAADVVERENYHLFAEREREVKERWLAELAHCPAETFFVQIKGPAYLTDHARNHLGRPWVFCPVAEFPDNRDLREFYRRISDELDAHLARHELTFDPAKVSAELWGESFEGCVPGYGGALAESLHLQQSPRMRFEMTVYDSRFLYGAAQPEVIPLPETDVEAFLFACYDGTGAAVFQSRRTAMWLDERRVHIRLDTRRNQVCTKAGHTIWPSEPWSKGKPETEEEYALPLSQFCSHWIRSTGMTLAAFRERIRVARIGDAACRPGRPRP